MPGAGQPRREKARGTKQINYSKFQHSSHAGLVGGVLRQTKSQELKCDYCHENPTPEKPMVTGYPNMKPGGAKITHGACIECHLMAGGTDYLLRVVAVDAADFERIHRERLARLPHVARLQSHLAIRTVRPWAGYPPRET